MLTGEIRMIKYGVIPSQPYFEITVGRIVGGRENLEVIRIVREFVPNGESEYHIECAKKDENGNKGNPFIWKTFLKKPDEIQYFVPDENHNYVFV